MNSLRNIEDHGNPRSVEKLLNKKTKSAQRLYYDAEIFCKLTTSIEWFMKEIYERVCQLFNQS